MRRVAYIMAYQLDEGDKLLMGDRAEEYIVFSLDYDRHDFEVHVQYTPVGSYGPDEVIGEFCEPGKQFKVVLSE